MIWSSSECNIRPKENYRQQSDRWLNNGSVAVLCCMIFKSNHTITIERERKKPTSSLLKLEDDFQFLCDDDGDDETMMNFKSNVR